MALEKVLLEARRFAADLRVGKNSQPVASLSCVPNELKDFSAKLQPQLEKDTPSFSGIVDARIADVQHPIKKTFLTELCLANPEKFKFLYDECGIKNNINRYYSDEFLLYLKKTDLDEIKKSFAEIQDFFKSLPKVEVSYYDEATKSIIKKQEEYIPPLTDYAILCILKRSNPDVYQYLLKNPNKKYVGEKIADIRADFDGESIKSLTVAQLKAMDNKIKTSELEKYIICSDDFVLNKKDVAVLSETIAKYPLKADITAHRIERSTGMFDKVKLDKLTALKIKWLILLNFKKAKKIKISEYNGKYQQWASEKLSLYDFIMSKKELTLADAMQVAKFADEKFISKILELIKKTELKEERFKSFTLRRDFVEFWRDSSDTTSIIQTATIKKGTPCTYSGIKTNARQCEIVTNNTPKNITFSNAVYDKEKDQFFVNSIVQSV